MDTKEMARQIHVILDSIYETNKSLTNLRETLFGHIPELRAAYSARQDADMRQPAEIEASRRAAQNEMVDKLVLVLQTIDQQPS
jgi:hypothetical protein